MRIWLYCIIRNEIRILPYFLRHYVPWCTKLIFYDDRSDDGTRELLLATEKCELRNWCGEMGIVDDQFLDFANEQWKEARGQAEWVIWVDADEFLYAPNMLELLNRYLHEGVEVPQVNGFTMVSRKFPTTPGQIYDEVRTGFSDGYWDKKAIFRANMFWTMGRHGIDLSRFNPKSSITCDIALLHYRGLGTDYVRWRHNRNWNRMPERCRRLNLGPNVNPAYVGHHSLAWFEEMIGRDWPNII
jgi:glycosyltransferase involved in cell wall biosynthesis